MPQMVVIVRGRGLGRREGVGLVPRRRGKPHRHVGVRLCRWLLLLLPLGVRAAQLCQSLLAVGLSLCLLGHCRPVARGLLSLLLGCGERNSLLLGSWGAAGPRRGRVARLLVAVGLVDGVGRRRRLHLLPLQLPSVLFHVLLHLVACA